MSLKQQEQIKILEGIYCQLATRYDQRQRVLDNLYADEPNCGPIGEKFPTLPVEFLDVAHGANCVHQMKMNIDDVEQRIRLKRNPPVPEQRMTDQQLFDRAIGDAQSYGVNIVELVQGLTK